MRWRRVIWNTLAVAAFILGAGVGLWAAGPPLGHGPVRAIELATTEVPMDRRDPARQRLGRLEWAGGLALSSRDRTFGGLSSALWEPECGRLLAVSDTGSWIVIAPRLAAGRLVGVSEAWIAPILGEDGQPAATKRAADAEAAHRTADGTTWVWFEGDHRAQLYAGVSACRPESLATPAHAIIRPPEIEAWPRNGGVESAAALGSGVVILAERPTNGADRREGWWFTDRTRQRFELLVDDDHDPVGLAALDHRKTPDPGPGADEAVPAGKPYLLLGRRFSPMRGMSARLDLVMLGPPPPALVEREPLARFEGSVTVDNFEALAVSHEAGGTYVWILSDDNFMPFQRTLLLRFRLLDPPSGSASAPRRPARP